MTEPLTAQQLSQVQEHLAQNPHRTYPAKLLGGLGLLAPVILAPLVEQRADVAITATAEASAQNIVATTRPVSLDQNGPVLVTFFFPAWTNGNAGTRTLTLVIAYSTDGGSTWTANGQVWRDNRAASATDFPGSLVQIPFGGTGSSLLFAVAGYASVNTGVTVRAQGFGSATYVSAWIRVDTLPTYA